MSTNNTNKHEILNCSIDGPPNKQINDKKKSDKIHLPEKVQKIFVIHNRTKKPLTSQNFKYSKTKYEVF